MKKIPTIFMRDWDGDRSLVLTKPNPECEWVFAGEGVATRKIDGTCCLVQDGKLFKRRELKAGQKAPPTFVSTGTDPETGKIVGWVPVAVILQGSSEDQWQQDKYHREAWFNSLSFEDGTYELIGPKIQGNPENLSYHALIRHGQWNDKAGLLENVPRDFVGLRQYLGEHNIEGIVFYHPDGRMAKIKGRDFGFVRTARIEPG